MRPGSSDGEYASLAPRQVLTPAPYALYAMNVAEHDHWGESWSGSGTGLTLSGDPIGVKAAGEWSGVLGHSSSPGGHGVVGRATAESDGQTIGVVGASWSTFGKGVVGEAVATSGTTQGVRGYSGSTEGTGVFGGTSSLSGAAYGLQGISRSTDGCGVCGHNYVSGTGVLAWSEGGIGLVIKSGGAVLRGYDVSPSEDLVFQVTNSGNVYADGEFYAKSGDFAEMLPGAEGLEPGDVLVVDLGGELARSAMPYDPTVVGVYSTQPGFVGGSDEEMENPGDVPLAVLGVVPVKVSGENGPVSPGDLLTTSILGHAMKAEADSPIGMVIGKALEGWDDGLGLIQMLVMLQ